MRILHASLAAAVLLCQTACAQQATPEPRIVTVPPDELTRTPSLDRPSVATPTPAATVLAKLEEPPPAAPARDFYTRCNVAGDYVAITFDDGPHPELTPKLLDMLKERGIRATFYVVGKNVVAHPGIVQRMVAEGHEIGNHSWTHTALTKLSPRRVASEMDDTTAAIVAATGSKPATMRPPYGATNASLNRRLNSEFGMKVILWSVDPLDWKYRNASRVASHIIEKATAGDIILAHDIHPSTIAAMPQTLDALQAKGFQFATVSELLAMDRPVEVTKREPVQAAPVAN